MVFPSPFGEADLESRSFTVVECYRCGGFHPLSGKRTWKVAKFVAITAAEYGFHPLSGKRTWKEFAVEALHRAGFRRRIDTPQKKRPFPIKN
jgi:hypothetical protein